MTSAMREWLLECPAIKGVSTLTADLHACRAIDLHRLLPPAIVREVATLVWRPIEAPLLPKFHERTAKMYSMSLRGKLTHVRRGVAVTQGKLSTGVGMCETGGANAVIHLRNVSMPHTVAAAAADRDMCELIDSPVFRRSRYPILSAEVDKDGLTIWFMTPQRVVPIAEALDRKRA